MLAITAAALGLTPAPAQAAGTRAGATRAAKRHVVTYVKRYGIVLRTTELDLQCSSVGRSRWKCFVYANGGQCTGTLTEAYSIPRTRSTERGASTSGAASERPRARTDNLSRVKNEEPADPEAGSEP